MPNTVAPSIKQFYFKDTSFADLMTHRIFNVLMIASRYDTFILEEDGRIDEQLFNEYVSLNLRYPPRFTQVSTEKEALNELMEKDFELIIVMSDSEGNDIFELAKHIKQKYSTIPIVVLTHFSREVSLKVGNEDLSAIDYVFSWLGNSDLLLAIIKLMEDRMNAKHDVETVGVQILLFVEDSTRFYSSILPYLYKFIFLQSHSFMTEALNAHQQMLRMRGRPKILLARTYDEAWEIYQQYQNNILGVVSDISFPYHKGERERKDAGFELYKNIRNVNKFIPYVFESSEKENALKVASLDAAFIDKNSTTLPLQLRQQLLDNFGFGDFIFRNPITGDEIARATNLKDLQKLVFSLPDDTVRYHFSQNHVSKWLYSRAMFPLAEFLRNVSINDFKTLAEARQALFDAIVQYRKTKNKGIVAVFQRDRFDKYSNFARIGSGSMGGKARGLAFLDSLVKRNVQLDNFLKDDVQITLPKTVVLCTDIFDEFMEMNNLYPIALSDIPDEEMLRYFLKAALPRRLLGDFMAFFEAINKPIAVRSSSLLEDSYYQPFAGIYSTYMIPYDTTSKTHMLNMLSDAIKGVYASVFYHDSKSYMKATSNVIDAEKMAIVLQEVVGTEYKDRFYPSFSGVARSINFYPIDPEQPEDGVVNVALGLGKHVVDGGVSLRFSPKYPHNVLQTSVLDIALRDTQTKFYALDLSSRKFKPTINDANNLLTLELKAAEEDGALRLIASTYDYNDEIIRDGVYPGGRKLITFANILKHDAFPLASILQSVLEIGQHEMGYPVEIEFAVNLNVPQGEPRTFNLLQIRPIVENKEQIVEDLFTVKDEDTILSANHALGNGIIDDVFDFVYVKPDTFDAANNRKMVGEIDAINARMMDEKRSYILVGPGRWGSSDPWLGIPVKWSNISAARIIVEAGLEHYRVDPSQGTHFFQNLTSFRVGYFTINSFINDGYYNLEFLAQQPAVFENEYIRHVRFAKPTIIKIDGKRGKGVVLRP